VSFLCVGFCMGIGGGDSRVERGERMVTFLGGCLLPGNEFKRSLQKGGLEYFGRGLEKVTLPGRGKVHLPLDVSATRGGWREESPRRRERRGKRGSSK